MIHTLIILQLMAPLAQAADQLDSICWTQCEVLTVQNGRVLLVDLTPPSRKVALGNYVAAAQHLVPKTEAPVCELQSSGGWRIVGSVFLDHEQREVFTHIRFFAPNGKLRRSDVVLQSLEHTQVGNMFGSSDEIFTLTSNEEHAYNSQTEFWLLPSSGDPKLLLSAAATLDHFVDGSANRPAGVVLALQAYDGVHADTKGTMERFYRWNQRRKILERAK